MAEKDVLRMFPMPKKPSVYTGFFQRRYEERDVQKENKCKCGVSYTRYGEMKNILCGNISLFSMLHGYCAYYADYFSYQQDGWEVKEIRRGEYGRINHAFCTKQIGGKTLFADIRGITDNPLEFFADFSIGRDNYCVSERDEDRMSITWFDKNYKEAYQYALMNNFYAV